MDIPRKLELGKAAHTSIATHEDADSVVILAALDALADDIVTQKVAVTARAAAEAAAAVGG